MWGRLSFLSLFTDRARGRVYYVLRAILGGYHHHHRRRRGAILRRGATAKFATKLASPIRRPIARLARDEPETAKVPTKVQRVAIRLVIRHRPPTPAVLKVKSRFKHGSSTPRRPRRRTSTFPLDALRCSFHGEGWSMVIPLSSYAPSSLPSRQPSHPFLPSHLLPPPPLPPYRTLSLALSHI